MIITGIGKLAAFFLPDSFNVQFQLQPCGMDLTLSRVTQWGSVACLDFDNTKRKLPVYEELPFFDNYVELAPGGYLVEFNEKVALPDDVMAVVYMRSSLFRCGASIHSGVIDPGYAGAVGALIQVWNEHGIVLHKNARLAQCVFTRLEERAPFPYNGDYQHRARMF